MKDIKIEKVRQALDNIGVYTIREQNGFGIHLRQTKLLKEYFDTLDQFITDVEEKETPKKPIWVRANEHITVDDHELSCPTCKNAIRFDFIAPAYRPKRCEWCGQILDWREENERH